LKKENEFTNLKTSKMKIIIMFLAGCIFLCSCSPGKKNIAQTQSPSVNNKTNSPLTETYWKLTELMGTQVITSSTDKKETYMILKKADSTINGHSGCNTFRGTYKLAEATLRISFSQMAGTRMACPDMKKENDFLEVLQKADNYTITGDTLSLNKARMAPLAKFEAVLLN
jgi:heat shock protein HslJ